MRRSPWPLLILLTWACQPKPEDLIETLEIVGCRDLRKGPICEIDGPTKLVIWVKVKEGAKVAIKTDHGPAAVKFHPYEDGYRTRFIATATAGAVIVEARRKGIDTRRWPLELHEKSELLKEAERLQSEGKEAEAKEKWEVLKDSKEPREAAEALHKLGLLDLQHGQVASATTAWMKAQGIAEREGLLSRATNELIASAQVLMDGDRDIELAISLQKRMERFLIVDDAVGRTNADFSEAVLAYRSGDLRSAHRRLRSVVGSAERLELTKVSWAALHLNALLLISLGRPDRAWHELSLQRTNNFSALSACKRASLLQNLSWAGAMAEEAGLFQAPDLDEVLGEALRLYEGSCPDAVEASSVHLTAGRVALGRGTLDEAKRHKDAAATPSAMAVSLIRAEFMELDAHLAMANGDPVAALAKYQRLRIESVAPGMFWRALVGEAVAWGALGKVDDALRAFREAQSVVDSEALAVAIDGGRCQFISSRSLGSLEEVEYLIGLGRVGAALDAARRSRAAAWRSLVTASQIGSFNETDGARWRGAITEYRMATEEIERVLDESWGRARDMQKGARATLEALRERRREALDRALGSLEAGETKLRDLGAGNSTLVTVLVSRAANKGLRVFVVHGRDTATFLAADLNATDSPDIAGRVLLDPLTPYLEQTKQVQFILDGAAYALDLHAATWRGAPLIETHEVTYSVDAPVQERRKKANWLIAADPGGDLPEARAEASLVAEQLQKQGDGTVLVGEEATTAALIRLLPTVDVFHYSGHARHDPNAGVEGAILLASGSQLTTGDILTLSDVPRRIVLSSCDAARGEATISIQLGVAHAFALRGSEQVLAAVRPVGDTLAKRVSAGIHSAPLTSLAEALRAIQVESLRDERGSDWSSFRVVTR